MALSLGPEYPLNPTQHVFICGQTGSGKTSLAEYLLGTRPYCLVIDTKHQLHWNGFRITSQAKKIISEPGQWIFRPPDYWRRDAPGERWGTFLTAVMRQGGWYVYIDEGHDFDMGLNGHIILEQINLFLVKGRSFGITGWFGSQRPRWVPSFVLSESSHMFCFFLKRRDDREYMAEYMVRDGRTDPNFQRIVTWKEPIHAFFYSRSVDGLCVPFKPLAMAQLRRAPAPPARASAGLLG